MMSVPYLLIQVVQCAWGAFPITLLKQILTEAWNKINIFELIFKAPAKNSHFPL